MYYKIIRAKSFSKDSSKITLSDQLSGDILVIYKIIDDTLYLVRIGSHSELFR